MNLFYTPDIKSDIVWLTEDDTRHCMKVLRLKKGDTINITDGKGILCEAEINDENFKACSVRIISTKQEYNKRNFNLHIAIAPTKNAARFEWFLEKAAEIGIDEITPIVCSHSERRTINIERLDKILVAAMKQSFSAYLPIINPCIEFKAMLSNDNNLLSNNNFIAVCEDYDAKMHLKNAYQNASNTFILIGPEGDFTKEEIKFAVDKGFKPVSLSFNRLRTETAGLVACEIVNMINEI